MHRYTESHAMQALAAAQQAIRKFEKAGTPWQRPPDYYAEMVKSDDHMAKVKQQLMHETQQMEAVEQRYISWGLCMQNYIWEDTGTCLCSCRMWITVCSLLTACHSGQAVCNQHSSGFLLQAYLSPTYAYAWSHSSHAASTQ